MDEDVDVTAERLGSGSGEGTDGGRSRRKVRGQERRGPTGPGDVLDDARAATAQSASAVQSLGGVAAGGMSGTRAGGHLGLALAAAMIAFGLSVLNSDSGQQLRDCLQ